jgi:hypothetical protein
MTDEEMGGLLDLYDAKVAELLAKYPVYPRVEHLGKLLAKLRTSLEEGRRDEVMRGIGFVQGVLWAGAHFTLRDLSWHLKPKVLPFNSVRASK